MSKKAVVLSSGGVDSTTCLGIAVEELGSENVTTVSITYGQKHLKEIECAKNVSKFYKVDHRELDLTDIFKDSNCALLVNSTEEIPEGSYASQINKKDNGMVNTYVPFRNGLMLAAAASLAVSLHPDDDVYIYIGAHADDAAGNAYADCSPEFTDAMNKAINLGTYGKVAIKAPLVNMTKADVVKKGLEIGVPYELTWSCYNGKDEPCGVCGTCIDRAKAFAANGVLDPILRR